MTKWYAIGMDDNLVVTPMFPNQPRIKTIYSDSLQLFEDLRPLWTIKDVHTGEVYVVVRREDRDTGQTDILGNRITRRVVWLRLDIEANVTGASERAVPLTREQWEERPFVVARPGEDFPYVVERRC